MKHFAVLKSVLNNISFSSKDIQIRMTSLYAVVSIKLGNQKNPQEDFLEILSNLVSI